MDLSLVHYEHMDGNSQRLEPLVEVVEHSVRLAFCRVNGAAERASDIGSWEVREAVCPTLYITGRQQSRLLQWGTGERSNQNTAHSSNKKQIQLKKITNQNKTSETTQRRKISKFISNARLPTLRLLWTKGAGPQTVRSAVS